MDYLDGLNDRQREAVLHTEGPLLILAGAGSGKTRVITHKIAYLIEKKGIFPGNILAITFTNKAANEMKERVGKLLSTLVDDMWIGTFHSVCVRILRRDIDKIGYDRSFTIYDRDDQLTLIKECIKERNLNKDLYKEATILSYISNLKDGMVEPDTFINENYKDFYLRNVGEVYSLYEKKLKQYN
ncbi:MAG TPA: UvrD-helicase domain-containing protein, partial [Tissierellaceae bacterium]